MISGFARTIFLLCLLTLANSSPASADEGEIDYLSLAAMLVKDGHYDRAAGALAELDPNDDNLDRCRYHTIAGLLELNASRFADAESHFSKASAQESCDALVHVYRAQALVGLERYEDALAALDLAGAAAEPLLGAWLLRAQCFWKLSQPHDAWDVLDRAQARFANAPTLLRQKVAILIELGLYRAAVEYGRELIALTPDNPDQAAAIAHALSATGQAEAAAALLETLRLRFPKHIGLTTALADAYARLGLPLAAADLYARAAVTQPNLNLEASEYFRLAGQTTRALYHNALIDDQKKKMRQRLGILLELGHFERAAALDTRLSRLGLLMEEDILYALAYARYQIRDFEGAEQFLTRLTRKDLFRQAAELRGAIEACKHDLWRCN